MSIILANIQSFNACTSLFIAHSSRNLDLTMKYFCGILSSMSDLIPGVDQIDDPWVPVDPLGEALHFLHMSGVFTRVPSSLRRGP